jgi:hypothetical protein
VEADDDVDDVDDTADAADDGDDDVGDDDNAIEVMFDVLVMAAELLCITIILQTIYSIT